MSAREIYDAGGFGGRRASIDAAVAAPARDVSRS
jgi:hypothetical protein